MVRKTRKFVLFSLLLMIVFAIIAFPACTTSEPTLKTISVSGHKIEFSWGEDFSVGDIVVTANYSDGSKKTLSNEDYVVDSSSYDKTQSGTYSIIVELKGTSITTSYNVTVKEPLMTSIEILNAKTEFSWGEDFTFDGVVKAVYEDGSKTDIESGYSVNSSVYNKNLSGQYQIIVSYGDFSQNYTIEVGSPKVNGIRVENSKEDYIWGENFLNSNIKVYKTYEDGSEVVANSEEYAIDSSEYNAEKEGSYDIVINLSGTQYQNTVSVNVGAPYVTGIDLSGYTTEFEWGEDFVFDGVVKSVYVDGIKITLTETEYSVDSSSYDRDISGEYTIIVSLNGTDIVEHYTVTVATAPIKSISVSSYKKEYLQGDELDFSDIVVIGTRADEETVDLSIDDLDIDYGGYEGQPGEFTITLSCKENAEVHISFEINVKKFIRIFILGNSYADDTLNFIPNILDELGYAYEVGSAFIAGCTLDQHYEYVQSGEAGYDFRYYEQENGEGAWNETYGGEKKNIEYMIKFRDWDVIAFQQGTTSSGVPEAYEKLDDIVSYVQSIATNENAKFVFNMTWAYQKNTNQPTFSVFDFDQIKMFECIADAVRTQVDEAMNMPIIPNGTAIQNARTSFVRDNLTRDGYHLTYDLGRYIAGLTLVAKLTGEDITKITFKPSGLSEGHKKVAIESALNAINNPYQITNSKYTSAKDEVLLENGFADNEETLDMDESANGTLSKEIANETGVTQVYDQMIYNGTVGDATKDKLVASANITVWGLGSSTFATGPYGGGIIIKQPSTGKFITIAFKNNRTNNTSLVASVSDGFGQGSRIIFGRQLVNSDPTGANAVTFDRWAGNEVTYSVRAEVDGYTLKIWLGAKDAKFDLSTPTWIVDNIRDSFANAKEGGGYSDSSTDIFYESSVALWSNYKFRFPFYADEGESNDIVIGFVSFFHGGTTKSGTRIEKGSVCYGNDITLVVDGKETTLTYTENDEVTLPIPKLYFGTEFKGWYDNAEFEGTPITKIEKGSTGNKKYYAQIEKGSYVTTTSGVDYLTEEGYYDINAGTLTVRASYSLWSIEGISAKNLFGTGFQLKQEGTGKIFKIRTDYGITTTRRLKITAKDSASGIGGLVNSYAPINTSSLSGLGSDFSVGTENAPYKLDMQMQVSGKMVKIWIGAENATFTDTNYNFLIEDIYTHYTQALAICSDKNDKVNYLWPEGTDASRKELAPDFAQNGKVMIGIPFYYVGTSAGLGVNNLSVTYTPNNQ